MASFADFDQHFLMCQKNQTFVKNFLELHIIKCILIFFQEIFSKFYYLFYFLSFMTDVVKEYYKREKS